MSSAIPIPKNQYSNSDYAKRMDAGQVNHPGSGSHWWKQLVTLDDFVAAGATTQTLDLNALFPNNVFPVQATVINVVTNLVEVAAGGTTDAASVTFGHAAEAPHSEDVDGFLASTNVFTGATLGLKQTAVASRFFSFPALDPLLYLTSGTADIDAWTTFKLEVMLEYRRYPTLYTA